MMEDADIASTFEMPANEFAEENPALEQVPQPSERAQLSERDQTETGTQNDNIEEMHNDPESLRETVQTANTPLVQQACQPDPIQVTEWSISNL